MTTPKLDIAIHNAYNSNVLAIADVSFYPVGYNPNNPYIEITPPGMPKVTLLFTPRGINVFNSENLNLTLDCPGPLPDGIYKLRYSIHPNYDYYVEKSILRIDATLEKLDSLYLGINLHRFDERVSKLTLEQVDVIELFLQGAMAAANKCDEKLAYELFLKANKLIDKIKCYVSNMHCVQH